MQTVRKIVLQVVIDSSHNSGLSGLNRNDVWLPREHRPGVMWSRIGVSVHLLSLCYISRAVEKLFGYDANFSAVGFAVRREKQHSDACFCLKT